MEKEPSIIRRLPRILGEHAQSEPALFCMPAHKGRGLAFFREGLAGWDVSASWLRGHGDPIRDIERRYSLFYQTADSFLLTCGRASALRVMLRALPKKERVIVPEGCDGDMHSGLVRAGLKASVLKTGSDPGMGRYRMPEPEEIAETLDRTGAGTVFLQSPDVYGYCANLPNIAEVAHSRGALLMVDASFGPHFPISGRLPDPAALYADIVCHCPFTGLNALNQSVAIHLNPCRVDAETLRRLTEEEDPDPSSLILASMDWALHSASEKTWETHLDFLMEILQKIDALPGLRTLRGPALKGSADHDASRIVIDASGRKLTGAAVMRLLEGRNIHAERADGNRILLITGPEDDPYWYTRLLEALSELPEGCAKPKGLHDRKGRAAETTDE